MFCKYCGQEIDQDSKFCNYCGANQMEGGTNSAAYNLGKALGTIGMLAATNAAVDRMNQESEESMRRTLQKGSESLNRIQAYINSQNIK